MTTSRLTHMHCEHCGAQLTDDDIRNNTIDHPHDGCWCTRCISLYYGTGDTYTVETLRTKYGTDLRTWTVKALDYEHAVKIAQTGHATDLNCWVGEIRVLGEMAQAA